jgi:putative salt-induced outer membrane protein
VKAKSAIGEIRRGKQGGEKMQTQAEKTRIGGIVALLVLILHVGVAHAEEGLEGSLNLGLTATTGNSRASTGNASLEAKLTRPESITHLGASATYGQSGGKTTADKSNAFAQYNYLLTERLSAYINLAWERDRVADLVWRINAGPGLGYYFIKRPDASLIGELGVSYVREKFENVKFDDYYALRVAERGEWKITETAKLWEKAEYLPDVSDFKKRFIMNGEAGVEAAITIKTSLRFLVQDTYNSAPAPGRRRNDTTYIAAVGYKF